MSVRFLVNPSAGGGRAKRRLGAIREAATAVGADVVVSCSGPDLVAQALEAVEDGIERLAVVGGDGTAHLAVQGLALSDCALALIPVGRGNDYAAALGVPSRFAEAVEVAVTGSARRRVDLGRVGSEWFAFYAGAGFDSETSRTAEGHPRWWPDSVTYAVAVLRTLAGFRPPMARISFDDGSFDGEVMFATVCNGPQFGGGMRIAPMAVLDDGLLDLVIVRAVSRVELLRIFPRVYSGGHVDHPAVSFHRTSRVRFEFEPAMLLGSDGELIASVGGEPVEARVVKGALRVVA